MPRITTHRALLDYYRRPTEPATAGVDPRAKFRQDESEKPRLPGIVGMTKHRIMIEIEDERVGNRLLEICDRALGEELSEGMATAITTTRTQITQAIEELR